MRLLVFWHLDKPKIQFKYCPLIVDYIFTLSEPVQIASLFFHILRKKWETIDNLRITKYLWLLRELCKKSVSSITDPQLLKKHINLILKESNGLEPTGLVINYFQMSVEELAKSDANCDAERIMAYISAIVKILSFSRKRNLLESFSELVKKVIDGQIQYNNINIDSVKEIVFQHAKQKNVNEENRKILYSLIQKETEEDKESNKEEESEEEKQAPKTHTYIKVNKEDKRKHEKLIKRASKITDKDGIPAKLKKLMDKEKDNNKE